MPGIERLADELRRRCGQAEPPFSTRQIIDIAFPDAVVTGRDLPAEVDELVTVTAEGPVILYRRGLPTADQRMAIAHAVGHLLLDLPCGAPAGFSAEVERRADHFALELLAPVQMLDEYVRDPCPADGAERDIWLDMVDELASHFHVPAWGILRQIAMLEESRTVHAKLY